MRTLLPGLGTAALGIAVLLTLALALTTKLFTLRPPNGPDAMGLVVVFFLPIGAWLLVLFGALACVARGRFDWVSRSPGIPTLAVLAFAGGFVLFLKGSAEDARRAEEGRVADEARQKEYQAEEEARRKALVAELAALADDTPLETFLTHLFIDKSEEHNRKAIERIRALPGLTERMAARLEHPEPLQREYVLNFVKMAGTPDPAWEPLVRRAIVRLAADYRAEAKDLPLGRISHVKGLSWGALLAAQTFGPKRFETEARELREAVAQWPIEDPRDDALEVIDLYLAGKPVPE